MMDDRQLANGIQTVALEVFYLFARPFVLTTRVFFHRDIGERWLSRMQAALGLVLIAAATLVSKYAPFIYPFSGNGAGYYLGIAWIVAYLYCMWEHFHRTVPNRYRKGIRWHSRSVGIPRHPALSLPVQRAILLGATIAAYRFGGLGLAALLAASLLMGIMADQAAAKKFWNQMLDAIDGQIEAEELGKAIEERLTPAESSGLNICMPAYVNDEFRRKLAEAVRRAQPQYTGAVRPQGAPAQPDRTAPQREPAGGQSLALQRAASGQRQSAALHAHDAAMMQPSQTDAGPEVNRQAAISQPAPAVSGSRAGQPVAGVLREPKPAADDPRIAPEQAPIARSPGSSRPAAQGTAMCERTQVTPAVTKEPVTTEVLQRMPQSAGEVPGSPDQADPVGYPTEMAVIQRWTEMFQLLAHSLTEAEQEYRKGPSGDFPMFRSPHEFGLQWAEEFETEIDPIRRLAAKAPDLAGRARQLEAQKEQILDWVARLQREYPSERPK